MELGYGLESQFCFACFVNQNYSKSDASWGLRVTHFIHFLSQARTYWITRGDDCHFKAVQEE
jgi:hypothetical protein